MTRSIEWEELKVVIRGESLSKTYGNRKCLDRKLTQQEDLLAALQRRVDNGDASKSDCLEPEDSKDKDEDLDVVDIDEKELDLGMEEDMATGPDQELPEEGSHLPTEREPSVRRGSSHSSRNVSLEELAHRKAERVQAPSCQTENRG
ncbi:hypothetical protein NDU88_005752 [Pleurodeles waltl]|uniref:Uncharacterized protein n=1 Tax=Pleurodeles waltl TaxID=8319 RepID=A0AAV7QG40_PLEWA|nr:hypothetical protein NDU88_005752 [Pleurodeles waltl]